MGKNQGLFFRVANSWEDDTHYSKPKKIFIAVVAVAILALGVLFGLIIFWKVAPNDGVRYEEGSVIDFEKDTYRAGEFATFRTTGTFCNDGYDVIVKRKLASPLGFLEVQTIGFFAPEQPFCITDAPATIKIPDDLPPGEWRLILVTEFRPYPARIIAIERVSEPITVIADPRVA